ncbi:hypothetical protein [Streptomyces sp. B29(2018)]|uniref:hypothetical protein n=1 Tax=Streptomyces sp. B29(2018) TaxID=2485016 RepID=UPI000FD6912C|nr:hypothetical protein [Streptomyces sp. B29(2018)]
MTGPSSAPNGERPGARPNHWETALTSTESVVADDTWDEDLPTLNRETRRALARKKPRKSNTARA